ncbi:hypothetical protein X769_26450 [Mesorhizobium sp. LSJC268A00]|nr:hypothetical protein X769_26450 [Mesorhizobium sp. LSJC268A00]ESX85534.1 hypothetical protein X756_22100 [Mesorhizobium sp. LSHC412B00]ESZ40267.1 hypothetical protein X731_26760 [Mesorhizobium sp. L2C054A000]
MHAAQAVRLGQGALGALMLGTVTVTPALQPQPIVAVGNFSCGNAMSLLAPRNQLFTLLPRNVILASTKRKLIRQRV